MEQNTICPDCGHQITAEDQQIKESIEETNTDATMRDKSTEDAVFPDSILFDRTIQVPPSLNPHFSACSSPPTSIGTGVTVISSANPLSKSRAPISSP